MPGAIAPNLQKADLAEDFGRLLMRSICSVAPISKADDFGIDTIATLLELDADSHLRQLATSTFALQFKAKSVREIPFVKAHEWKWLSNLELPYFVGSVDLEKAQMELFTINWVTSLPDYHNFKGKVALHLDTVIKKDKILRLYLGPPVMIISISDLTNSIRIKEMRELMRCWLKSEFDNIRQRKLGHTRSMEWETNEAPQVNAHWKVFSEGGVNLELLKDTEPYLDAALIELARHSADDNKLIQSIENIVTKLTGLGMNLETYTKVRSEGI